MRPSSSRIILAVLAFALLAPRGHGQSATGQSARCAPLKVSCPDVVLSGLPVTFTAEGGSASSGVTYEWVVSAGVITGGQGTSSITLDTTGLSHSEIVTATVEAKGLPESCPKTAACSVSVVRNIDLHGKIDEYGNIRFSDEKARLDNFALELRSQPGATGYIICYGGRVGRAGEARRRCDRAAGYVVDRYGREFNPLSVVRVEGGYREDLTVELWVIPTDATPPTATPTVDPAEVKIIRGRAKARTRRRRIER